jgi:putative ferrous iron transport protein C
VLLSRLSEYLAARGRASLQEIAIGIDAEPSALRGMLGLLERKGRVRKLDPAVRCGNCTGCAQGAAEVYEWIGSDGN